jgi:hypothetical protein
VSRGDLARLVVGLLERGVPDADALAGDLLEECRHRSLLWICRQVAGAIAVHAVGRIRQAGGTWGPAAAHALAVYGALALYVVFAANVIARVLVGAGLAPAALARPWHLLDMLGSLLAAVVIGHLVGRLHRRHRVTAVVTSGVSLTASSLVHAYLLMPDLTRPAFLPAPGLQVFLAVLFLGGLMAGAATSRLAAPRSPRHRTLAS